MRNTPQASHAIVRDVPSTYDRCIRSDGGEPIDVARAREQHGLYCDVLSATGITLHRVAADDRYPDCCFVEDPVMVCGESAIMLNVGAATRRGEGEAIGKVLSRIKRPVHMEPPGTLEGGDVLHVEETLFVGLTARTTTDGVDALRMILDGQGIRVVPVETEGALHLKSVCAYLGDGHLVVCPGHFDDSAFADYQRIEVPSEEAYAANCLSVNGKVIMAAGYPITKQRIEAAGFATAEVPVTEFRKGDGGVSCLSILF